MDQTNLQLKINSLLDRQGRLEGDVSRLRSDLNELKSAAAPLLAGVGRVASVSAAPTSTPPPLPPAPEVPPAQAVPPAGKVPPSRAANTIQEPAASTIPAAPAAADVSPHKVGTAAASSPSSPQQAPAASSPPPVQQDQNEGGESLELRFGRVWLVRLGILFVVTGFAFLCHFAYHGFFAERPPEVKVAGLLLSSIGLAVAGHLFARRDSLRLYGRVVAAGGCAMVYYTAFAASHFEGLKVIESPVTAGVLLTLVALGIACYSRWQRAPGFALGALLLAYYGVLTTPLGWFAVVALTVLALAALALAASCRMPLAGWLSLIATYGAYLFWQGLFYGEGAGDPGRWPLVLWWLLHTSAALPGARHTAVSGHARTYFLTINHAALLASLAFDWNVLGWSADLGWIALGMAVVVAGIGVLAWRREGRDSLLCAPHFGQAVALLALALIVELDGYQLFVALGAQGAALMWAGSRMELTVLRAGGWLVSLTAAGLALYHAVAGSAPALSFIVLALIFLATAPISRAGDWSVFGGKISPAFGGHLFPALALVVLYFGALENRAADVGVLILAGIGLAFELGPRFSGTWRNIAPETSRVGRLALVCASLLALNLLPPDLESGVVPLAAGPLLGLAGIMLMAAFLRHSGTMRDHSPAPSSTLRDAYLHVEALLPILVLGTGLYRLEGGPSWMVTWPVAGALLAAAAYTLKQPRQLLHAHWLPFVAFAGLFYEGTGVLEDVTGLLVFALLATVAYRHRPLSSILEQVARAYLLATAAWFSLWWMAHLPHPWLALALVAGAVGWLYRSAAEALDERFRAALVPCGLLLAGASLCALLGNLPGGWTHHAALVALLAMNRFIPLGDIPRKILAILLPALLFVTLTGHAQVAGHGEWLALIWTAGGFGLLVSGLASNDRPLRIAGLAFVAAALGHAVLVDVWKISSLLRVLSFTGLGCALLAAGYIYNRWHATLRKLL